MYDTLLEYASLFGCSLQDAHERWMQERQPQREWCVAWNQWMVAPNEQAARMELFQLWKTAVRLHEEEGVSVFDLWNWGRVAGRNLKPATKRVLRFEALAFSLPLTPTTHMTLVDLGCWCARLHQSATKGCVSTAGVKGE